MDNEIETLNVPEEQVGADGAVVVNKDSRFFRIADKFHGVYSGNVDASGKMVLKPGAVNSGLQAGIVSSIVNDEV
ncbi:MAG: hypothetical protein GY861_22400 [bacterium]|nr:hypothetical protein [bacterium]